MRRLLTAAITALALPAALITATISPAAAVSATLTIPDGVLYSGCHDYTYSYTLDLPTGTTNWSLDLDITKPDGTKAASDYVYGTGRIGTLDSDFFLCGSEDAGTFTATGTVTGRGAGIGTYELNVTPATFTMRRPQSQTAAQLAGKAKCGKTVTIATTSLDERPAGFFPASGIAYVALEQKHKGSWTMMEYSDTFVDSAGRAEIDFTWSYKNKKRKKCRTVKVRATTLFDAGYREASYSKVIKLKP